MPQKRVYSQTSYVAPFSWTGFYVGANVGYGQGPVTETVLFNGTSLGSAGVNPKGFIGGAQVGYNYQFDNRFVLGVEADFDLSAQSGSIAGVDVKYTRIGTVRGRVGYAYDRWLPYLTGGYAFGRVTASTGGITAGENRNGWALGAGVEYALNQSWSVKGEYLYVDLGKTTENLGSGFTADTRFKDNLFRLGVNYRF